MRTAAKAFVLEPPHLSLYQFLCIRVGLGRFSARDRSDALIQPVGPEELLIVHCRTELWEF